MLDLWLLIALLAVGAVALILPALFLRRGGDDAGGDPALYEEQLAELEAERRRGEIDAAGYQAARREIGRRLAAARARNGEAGRADESASANPDRRPDPVAVMAAVVVAIAVPAAAIGAYLISGEPGMPDRPLAQRQDAGPAASLSRDARSDLVVQAGRLEKQVEKSPEDTEAWQNLGRARMSLGQPERAAVAYRQGLDTAATPAPGLRAAFGEALVQANRGRVGERATQAFRAALDADPENVRAQYYLGERARQQGHPEKAVELWQTLLANAPDDAAWRQMVQARLVALAQELGKDPVEVLPNGKDAAPFDPSA